jgi:hypothetical protein
MPEAESKTRASGQLSDTKIYSSVSGVFANSLVLYRPKRWGLSKNNAAASQS